MILLVAAYSSRAAVWTWTGNGGNVNWSTGGNWNLGSAPASASTTDLVFAGTNNTGTALIPLNQNIASPFQLNNLTFASGSGRFFLGGNPLSFTGAGSTITQSSSNAQSIANNISPTTNIIKILTLAGNGTGLVTLSGVIADSNGHRDYAILKTGTSVFSLTGANTYTGATTISGGVLNIQNSNALGSTDAGTSVASGAALQIQGGIAVGIETLTLNGSGIASDGAFRNISGNNSFAGAITLASASTIASDAGTLTLSGNVNNGGFLFTETGAGNVTITGVISGSGGLTKTGTGTLTLSGATSNTYTGSTTVSAGTLVLAKPIGAIDPAITIGGSGASATVQLNAAYQLYGAATTINAGGLLNLNNNNEYIGTLALNGGTITMGSGSLYLGGTVTSTASNVTSTMAGNYIMVASRTFDIASGTTASGNDLIISGPISQNAAGLSLTKTGSGNLVLSGTNTFTGATIINNGTLTVAAPSGSALGSTGSITVNSGGTLMLGASNQINNTAPITLAGGTFSKGDFSEGTASGPGLGALTLNASGSQIDFGSGTVGVLTFAGFNPGSFTLTVLNWTGTPGAAGSGSTDRLVFNSDQSGNLGSFVFDGYVGATQFNLGGGYYEVTPTAVPEPSTYLAAALALATIGFHQARRLRRSSKRA